MAGTFRKYLSDFGKVVLVELTKPLVAHAHSQSHLVFWISGETDNVMDVGGESIPLNHQFGAAVNGWEPHSHSKGPLSSMFLAFYFERDWLQKGLQFADKSPDFSAHRVPLTSELKKAIAQLATSLKAEPSNSDFDLQVRTILELTRSALKPASKQSIDKRAKPDDRVSLALEYMNNNIGGSASLKEVARACGLSRANLFVLFRKQLNSTPNVYWNMLRMEKAFRLLTESDMTIAEISHKLGFSEAVNFSRFFLNNAGVPPSRYR